MDIGLLSAFVGGVLTLLSPCSAMLLPAFFSYAFTSPLAVMSQTGIFYLGLITTLVPLGVLAGTLGALVNQYRGVVVTVAAAVVIFFGLIMLLGVSLPSRPGRNRAPTSTASVFSLGMIYGLAGVCAGPLLGTALTVATVTGNALHGGMVLMTFAAGMALPLLLLALVWSKLPWVQALVRPREIQLGRWRNTWTGVIGGLLTIAVGALLAATNGTATLSGVLSPSDQAQLESTAAQITDSVPDALVLAITALLALGGWLVMRHRSKSTTTRGTHDD